MCGLFAACVYSNTNIVLAHGNEIKTLRFSANGPPTKTYGGASSANYIDSNLSGNVVIYPEIGIMYFSYQVNILLYIGNKLHGPMSSSIKISFKFFDKDDNLIHFLDGVSAAHGQVEKGFFVDKEILARIHRIKASISY